MGCGVILDIKPCPDVAVKKNAAVLNGVIGRPLDKAGGSCSPFSPALKDEQQLSPSPNCKHIRDPSWIVYTF